MLRGSHLFCMVMLILYQSARVVQNPKLAPGPWENLALRGKPNDASERKIQQCIKAVCPDTILLSHRSTYARRSPLARRLTHRAQANALKCAAPPRTPSRRFGRQRWHLGVGTCLDESCEQCACTASGHQSPQLSPRDQAHAWVWHGACATDFGSCPLAWMRHHLARQVWASPLARKTCPMHLPKLSELRLLKVFVPAQSKCSMILLPQAIRSCPSWRPCEMKKMTSSTTQNRHHCHCLCRRVALLARRLAPLARRLAPLARWLAPLARRVAPPARRLALHLQAQTPRAAAGGPPRNEPQAMSGELPAGPLSATDPKVHPSSRGQATRKAATKPSSLSESVSLPRATHGPPIRASGTISCAQRWSWHAFALISRDARRPWRCSGFPTIHEHGRARHSALGWCHGSLCSGKATSPRQGPPSPSLPQNPAGAKTVAPRKG